MAKSITMYESDDGQRFESLAACEEYETTNRNLYLLKLRDEIGYREVPLFEERKYGAYIVPPVTILTARPRSISELETIADVMRKDISETMPNMPGFVRDPKNNSLRYTGAAKFPMTYSVMVERYRRRKRPTVKLFSGYEFSRLANLCTGPVDNTSVPPAKIQNGRPKAKMITYQGQTHTLTEWSKIYNIDRTVVYSRIYNGWSIEKALTTPKRIR